MSVTDGASDTFTVTDEAPADMAAFARIGGDHNPLHRSVLAARLGGRPTPIVHGMWTAARAEAIVVDAVCPEDPTRLHDWTVRFTAPVERGAALRFEVTARPPEHGDHRYEVVVWATNLGGDQVVAQASARVAPPPTALLFPGQGIQRPGLHRAPCERSPAARAVWDRADAHVRRRLGFSLLDLAERNPTTVQLTGGSRVHHPAGMLHRTEVTQVALVALAAAQMAELRAAGVLPPTETETQVVGLQPLGSQFRGVMAAGHSVGELNALVALGVLPFEAALDLAWARGRAMQAAVARDAGGSSPYRLAAVDPGATEAEIDELQGLVAEVARDRGELAEVVNHNGHRRQYVVAGTLATVGELDRRLATRPNRPGRAIRAVRVLDGIDVPFHSSVLRTAVPVLRGHVEALLPRFDHRQLVGRWVPNLVGRPFSVDPDFVGAVEAFAPGRRLVGDGPDQLAWMLVVELLAQQIANPVRWIEVQQALVGLGVLRQIEVGPAHAPVLSDLARHNLLSTGPATPPVEVLHAERDLVHLMAHEPTGKPATSIELRTSVPGATAALPIDHGVEGTSQATLGYDSAIEPSGQAPIGGQPEPPRDASGAPGDPHPPATRGRRFVVGPAVTRSGLELEPAPESVATSRKRTQPVGSVAGDDRRGVGSRATGEPALDRSGPERPGRLQPKSSRPAVGTASSGAGSQGSGDEPIGAAEAARFVLALQAQVRLDQLREHETLDELFHGVSSRRNQVLIDLGRELGLGGADGLLELPLAELGGEIGRRASRYSFPGPYLGNTLASTLNRLLGRSGMSRSDAQHHLATAWGLPSGRADRVLLSLVLDTRTGPSARGGLLGRRGDDPLPATPAAAHRLLDEAVEDAAREWGLDLRPGSAVPDGPVGTTAGSASNDRIERALLDGFAYIAEALGRPVASAGDEWGQTTSRGAAGDGSGRTSSHGAAGDGHANGATGADSRSDQATSRRPGVGGRSGPTPVTRGHGPRPTGPDRGPGASADTGTGRYPLDNDSVERLAVLDRELGADLADRLAARFDPRRVVHFDAPGVAARWDLVALYHDALAARRAPVELQAEARRLAVHAGDPALAATRDWFIHRAGTTGRADVVALLSALHPGVATHPATPVSRTPPPATTPSLPTASATATAAIGTAAIAIAAPPPTSSAASATSDDPNQTAATASATTAGTPTAASDPTRTPTTATSNPTTRTPTAPASDPLAAATSPTASVPDGNTDTARPGVFRGEVALVTGASPRSIGAELVRELLRGGATVVVTTSTETVARRRWYRELYRMSAAPEAELRVAPANLASIADIDALVAWLDTDGLVPTIVAPFAALPTVGETGDLGTDAEVALRLQLLGVERLVAAVGRLAGQRHVRKEPRTPQATLARSMATHEHPSPAVRRGESVPEPASPVRGSPRSTPAQSVGERSGEDTASSDRGRRDGNDLCLGALPGPTGDRRPPVEAATTPSVQEGTGGETPCWRGSPRLADEALDAEPSVTVLLPLSPNHGQFGGDGVYAETKAALEVLARRSRSEHRTWGRHVRIIGARIGWVRGTGLMGHNDRLAPLAEAWLGIRTFSASEMGRLLAEAVAEPGDGGILDLSGGLADPEAVAALATLADGGLAPARAPAPRAEPVPERAPPPESAAPTPTAAPEPALAPASAPTPAPRAEPVPEAAPPPESAAPTPTAAPDRGNGRRAAETGSAPVVSALPSTPTSIEPRSVRPAPVAPGGLPARDMVVIVGMGELGPCGTSLSRFALELGEPLPPAAVVELAWLCGLVRFERDGYRAHWVDAADGTPLEEADLAARYHDAVLERVGIRPLEADGVIDPAGFEVLTPVRLDRDVTFEAGSEAEARSFLTADPTHTVVRQDPATGTWRVTRRAGTPVRVPRLAPPTRRLAGQFPTGLDLGRFGVPTDLLVSADRMALVNLACTAEAFRHAGIEPPELLRVVHPALVANTQGAGMGGMASLRHLVRDQLLDEPRQGDRLQESLGNVMAAHVVQSYVGSYGPMVHPVAACATAAVSLEEALDKIRSGKARAAVAGGFDDLTPEGMTGFGDMEATAASDRLEALGLTPGEASRANDRRRCGFVESQGGGAFLVVRGDVALELGLPVRAVLVHAGSHGDGIQRSIPAPGRGLLAAGRGGAGSPLGQALARHGLSADDIAVVSKHDTSTEANDVNEADLHQGLAEALGRTPGNPLLVVSQKTVTGHAKGGAAAWQVAGVVQMMETGTVPGNRNLDAIDPRLWPYHHLVHGTRPTQRAAGEPIRAALVSSLGFGHVSALLALAHPDVFAAAIEVGGRDDYLTRAAARRARGAQALLAVRHGQVAPIRREPDGDVLG